MSAWDRAETVQAWQDFGARFDRYHAVNAALAEHADLAGSRRVLDVGAGTGGTARALLARLPAEAELCCVEPAAAMRQAAELDDPRVSWLTSLPEARFDRIVCGASLWLLGPLEQALDQLRARLAEGGALVFAIPAAYLGEPDAPGGGPDPHLVEPAQRFVAGRPTAPQAGDPLPDAAGLEEQLRGVGLRPEPWSVQTTWSFESYTAWLALPPVAEAMRPDLDEPRRRALLAEVAASCAPGSWRTERWRGWTAWA